MYQVLYLVHTQVALGWLGSVAGTILGAYPGSTRMAWQCVGLPSVAGELV